MIMITYIRLLWLLLSSARASGSPTRARPIRTFRRLLYILKRSANGEQGRTRNLRRSNNDGLMRKCCKYIFDQNELGVESYYENNNCMLRW